MFIICMCFYNYLVLAYNLGGASLEMAVSPSLQLLIAHSSSFSAETF